MVSVRDKVLKGWKDKGRIAEWMDKVEGLLNIRLMIDWIIIFSRNMNLS